MSGASHRIFLIHGDTSFAPEAAAALNAALPAGWELVDEPSGAHVILAAETVVDTDLASRAGPQLSVVATSEPVADNLTALHPGLRIVSLPTESSLSRPVVAEYAVLMILALHRNLLALARTAVDDPWGPDKETPILTDQSTYVYNWTDLQGSGFLWGTTVGIVGVGAIGLHVAEMLAPFHVRLLYAQRNRLPRAEEQRLGLEWRELDDLLRESDAVTLHHRLQEGPDGNERRIGAREFGLMKRTAFLVNTARGRLLDEDALVDALRRGEIGGVALDVFEYEPLPKDHPLLSLAGDTVILTPHLAAGSEAEYWDHVLAIALETFAETTAGFSGAPGLVTAE